ncbi:hypothetical protein [Streptomyces lydicus]|uniref:hypothetical protein n=1 Tax=Streptomyces lydicus TaxID=47763 RepID=UPI0037A03DB0
MAGDVAQRRRAVLMAPLQGSGGLAVGVRASGDQQRLGELKAQRQECLEDQDRLRQAGPEEITRIAALYTARLKELEASEPPPEP